MPVKELSFEDNKYEPRIHTIKSEESLDLSHQTVIGKKPSSKVRI